MFMVIQGVQAIPHQAMDCSGLPTPSEAPENWPRVIDEIVERMNAS